MRTITNETLKITYPEAIFETRGLFSYIKVEIITPAENQTIILTLTCGDKNINLVRKTNKDGVVVFPIGRISESLISGNESNSVNFSISFYGISYSGNLMYAITGFADREIFPGWGTYEKPTTFYPASDCIVVYPNSGFKQYLFFPIVTPELFVLTDSSTTTNEYIGHSYNNPIVEFDPSEIPDDDLNKPLSVGIKVNGVFLSNKIKTYYDYCDKGVFLRWKDAAGIPYMYRWSLGSETDEITVNSAYNVLDENLNIKEVQTKTLANRYVLNSRLVERDIFNLCRTIIGCQELQMYNPKSSTWDSFVIEDSELEDNGAVMQNIEIEIVKYNYL